MSSANIMGSDKLFIVAQSQFMYITKTGALELILGELHVLLFPSLRKILSIIR
jgi:hypothetical protein